MIKDSKTKVGDLQREGRRGIIRMSRPFLEDGDLHLMSLVMSKLIVVRAEMLYAENELEYVCLSPEFRQVDPACATPRYQVVATLVSNGWCAYEYEVNFREVK